MPNFEHLVPREFGNFADTGTKSQNGTKSHVIGTNKSQKGIYLSLIKCLKIEVFKT